MLKSALSWLAHLWPIKVLGKIWAMATSESLPHTLWARRLMVKTKGRIWAAAGVKAPSAKAGVEIGEGLREGFENLWSQGDPWDLATSEFEKEKYLRQLALVDGLHYKSVLEIGCGNACFSRLVSRIADRVLAMDISESAIAHARAICADYGNIQFRVANIMDVDAAAEGPFDLMVMSETIYYVEAAYGYEEAGSLARRLFAAMEKDGRFLMTNGVKKSKEPAENANMKNRYRDLMLNAGFQLEGEEVFQGSKGGKDLLALISVFRRP